MSLEPHQSMNTVLARKPRYYIIPVLPDSLHQIGSDADVEYSVLLAGQHVNEEVLFRHSRHLKSWIPAFAGMTDC